MKRTKKRILSTATAAALLVSMLATLLAGCQQRYVPEGYVPEGYVPAGYISIDDVQALLSAVTLMPGTLTGETKEISDETGDDISDAVMEMASVFVSAGAPTVNSRDWSVYTSQRAKEGLTFQEAAYYDRIDALCRKYIDDASLNGVPYPAYDCYVTDKIPFDDLNLTKDQAVYVYYWFKYNNPQYYFVDSALLADKKALYPYIYDFAVDGEERVKITNKLFDKLDGWIEQVNDDEVTTWQKEMSANELLCDKADYDHDTTDARVNQTMYSTVMLEMTVCAGYAETFAAMMNASGVETVVVLSPTHAWNVVHFDDGNDYAVDVTWNDTGSDRTRYMNVGEKTLKARDNGKESHTYSDEYYTWSPVLPQTDYSPTNYDKTGSGSNGNSAKLSTPKNLRVVGDEDGKVYFEWDAVDQATGYTVELYDGDMTELLNSGQLTGPSVSVTYGSRTSIAVRVRAEAVIDGEECVSDWSDFLSTKTADPAQTPSPSANTVKLDAPKNVKITKDEANTTHFSWDKVEDADQYQVILFKDSDYKETWVSAFSTSPTKGFTKLQANKTYYYGIRAMKTVDGNDYYSDWTYFSHKTPADTSPDTSTDKPSAPKNVKTVSLGEDSAQTTWDSVSGATGYQIQLYKDSEYKEFWVEFAKTDSKITLTKLKEGRTYYYTLRAVKSANGKDSYSDWVKFSYTHTSAGSTLATPANVKTVSLGGDSAQTTWDSVSGATEYQIQLYKDSQYQEFWVEFSKTGPKITLNKLQEGRTYYYAIRAVKSADGSDDVYSDWVKFSYTHTGTEGTSSTLAAPKNVKTVSLGEDSAQTTWDSVSGATGYQIHLYKDSQYQEFWVEFSKTDSKITLAKLQKGTTYYYAIRAVKSADGSEVYSDWVKFSYTHEG